MMMMMIYVLLGNHIGSCRPIYIIYTYNYKIYISVNILYKLETCKVPVIPYYRRLI